MMWLTFQPGKPAVNRRIVSAIGRLWWLWAVAVCGPLLALSVTWLPLIAEYRVTAPALSDAALTQLQVSPSAATLTDLQQMDYGVRRIDDQARIVEIADLLLDGVLALDGYESVAVGLLPESGSFTHGPAAMQLKLASMLIPDLLLQAYEASGDRHYFESARLVTLAWARMERDAWVPSGLLWNDHAIASRILYLARFWRQYRMDAAFDIREAGEILGFVSRSAEHLARETRYTYRTNHGIMQNLGLLHVAAAFPELPRREAYLSVALGRLARHLPYFVSPDGVILEHSASYQEFGVELLYYLDRYLQILQLDRPDAWRKRSANSYCFLRHIVRPDGSYPYYGDSFGQVEIPLIRDALFSGRPLLNARCSDDFMFLDEDFGAASYRGSGAGLPAAEGWDAIASHTFAAWANFRGGAHKHADESSVFAWFAGQDWWVASGYWPFGDPVRESAVSWSGSNAPHLRGEEVQTQRVTSLLNHASSDALLFLDLERVSTQATFRRQVLHLSPDVWVVLDSNAVERAAGTDSVETFWTVSPDVLASKRLQNGMFGLQSKQLPAGLDVAFLGGDGHSVALGTGRREPFMGMVSGGGKLAESQVFAIGTSQGSWSGTVWAGNPRGAGHVLQQLPVMNWGAPDDWQLMLRLRTGDIEIVRQQGRLKLSGDGTFETVSLSEGQSELHQLTESTNLFMLNANEFPLFSDYLSARVKVSYMLLALLLVHWLFLAAGLKYSQRLGMSLTLLALFGWTGLSGWLYLDFLS